MTSKDHSSKPDVRRTSVSRDSSVALTIVRELAILKDRPPTELEPIGYDIDPDQLEWIVDGAPENKATFETNGYAVTVYGDGTLTLASSVE